MRIMILTVSIVALASCYRSNASVEPPVNNLAGMSVYEPASTTYKMLHSFSGGSDGANPLGALTAVRAELYGTTSAGGYQQCYYSGYGLNGCGTIFVVSAAGKVLGLHSFTGSLGDGAGPEAGLTLLNGSLYGTTAAGGRGCAYYPVPGCGTVFVTSTSGSEKLLYAFKGGSNGQFPFGPLTLVNGAFYGSTQLGGDRSYGFGTIFETSASGKQHVVYRFHRKTGGWPETSLLELNGILYGEANNDGAHGVGTVFAVSTSGSVRWIYSFGGRAYDAEEPKGGLVLLNDTFYGTTWVGGADNKGAVFSISKSGKERVIYSFGGTPDGSSPVAGLIAVNGELYGVTGGGGTNGYGSVFELSTTGKEQVLYSFRGYPHDGASPEARLTALNGTLYGTTFSGGRYGLGTIFRIAP